MPASFYKKLRKAGSIEDLRLKIWRAVEAAERVLENAMETPEDTDRCARAIHASIQAQSAYAKVIIADDQERRIKALEDAHSA